ncbi:MAG TPA: slipin family protein [Actinomycetes bacterium]|nr:slipin family protein [Actinomycetes bacterium]
MELGLIALGILALLFLIAIVSGIRVVQEYERGVVFRFGRVLHRAKGPGLIFIVPYGVDRMVKVNLQTVAMQVPAQDVITRDNVTVRVDAVVYFQVVDPLRAVVAIQNYLFATSQVAQTTLRAILGKVDLDDLLTQREQINNELARVIDDLTEPWGVKVSLVEIRNIDLPESMQRAMARQAEAERDRRARVISADGEFQASQKLSEAAEVMSRNPQALQLRFLQTVQEVATERNSTLVMPVPVELLNFFERMGPGRPGGPPPAARSDQVERSSPEPALAPPAGEASPAAPARVSGLGYETPDQGEGWNAAGPAEPRVPPS